MGIISAKQLNASLEKAKGVGIVEGEPFTIGDCEVVLRNLRPDEYESIVSETKELEDLVYLDEWQKGHVARAVVQLNGVDLRGTKFVEDEEPDPKNKGQVRAVKREVHDWLRKNILSTWGKEAMFTAYRKFTDVVFLAENKSKDGIQFVVSDETNEEKYRRLLGEMKEAEAELPPLLARAILEEYGYVVKEALPNFEEGGAEKTASPESVEETAEQPPASVAKVTEAPKQAPSLADVMRQRVPLNTVMVPPEKRSPEAAPAPVQRAPEASLAPVSSPKPSRTAEIEEALSAEPGVIDPSEMRAPPPQAVVPPGMPGSLPPMPTEKAVLSRAGTVHTDPHGLATILNPKPSGVMNPKFRPSR